MPSMKRSAAADFGPILELARNTAFRRINKGSANDQRKSQLQYENECGGAGCGANDLAYRNVYGADISGRRAKRQLHPKIRCDGCGGIIKNYADGFALVDTPSPKDSPKVETISDPIFLCAGCEKSEQRKGDSRRSRR